MTDPISQSLGMMPFAREIHEVSEAADDAEAISQVKSDVDVVIAHGITAMRESFEKAGQWTPKDQNKAREVGAQLMRATLDALNKKWEMSGGQKVAATGQQQTNVTNIITDRNNLIKMLRQGGLTMISTEELKSESEPK